MTRKKSRSCYTRRKKGLLPQEVVVDILSWLPVKSLLRFRCVCKSWNRLLRDPDFIQLHVHLHQSIKANNNNHLNSHTSMLFLGEGPRHTDFRCAENYKTCQRRKTMKLYFPTAEKIITRDYIYLVSGICNGLICLANLSECQSCFEAVYLWNPLLREHIAIPSSTLPFYFSPAVKRCTRFGFGYLQSTVEYKLIRIVYTPEFKCSESEYRSHVSVYSLRTDLWTTLEPIFYRLPTSPAAFVNEALHWLAARPTESLSWSSILSFDLKDEVFQEIPQPNGLEDYHCSSEVKVGELQGLLCIFCVLPDGEDVQIWVMKEYGVVDSWTKQYKIGRTNVRACSYSLQPLCLADNGEIILQKAKWQSISYNPYIKDKRLISYNPKTNSTTNLKELCRFHQVHTFVGSLVSPNSFKETIDIDIYDDEEKDILNFFGVSSESELVEALAVNQ